MPRALPKAQLPDTACVQCTPSAARINRNRSALSAVDQDDKLLADQSRRPLDETHEAWLAFRSIVARLKVAISLAFACPHLMVRPSFLIARHAG